MIGSLGALVDQEEAFERAVREGDVAAIREAIANGVNVNQSFVHRAGRAEFLLTGVSRTITPPIVAAAESYEPEAVTLLVEAGADVNAKREPDGWSALSVAAVTQNPRMARAVRVLLDAGADVDSKNGHGKTALMRAADLGSVQTVRLLLAAGTDPAAGSNVEGTALDIAKRRNNYLRHMVSKVLRTSIALGQPDGESTASGWTALMRAAKEGDKCAVKEQLLQPDVAVNAQDCDGWTALMWAASPYGSSQQVELLLEAGADPNLKTPEGWTALMSAVVSNDEERVRKLIDAGADVNCRIDTRLDLGSRSMIKEEFPVTAALRYGSLPLVRILLEAGADISRNTRVRKDVKWRARKNSSEDKEQILKLVTAHLQAAPKPRRAEDVRLLSFTKTRPSLGPPSIRARKTNAKRAANGKTELFGLLSVSLCQTDIAADILCRVGNREWQVGSFTAQRQAGTQYARYRALFVGFEAEHIDLVIRPNPALAVAQLETWEIWGEEIVLGNISVSWER